MFRKIKQWFNQEITRRSPLQSFAEVHDPRELPRPAKSELNDFTAAIKILDSTGREQCPCKNCMEISDSFAECAICMEPLQGVAICSCLFCGNYTCWKCSERVVHCPYCRASFQNENRMRNFGLERVLSNLELPCRHARFGCRKQLKIIERAAHESNCVFAPSGCPLVKLCGWHGDITNIGRHLKEVHDLQLIASNSINIEITDFRIKLLSTISAPRLYTVSLTCHGNIFICKLKLQNQKLRMIFFQITGHTAPKDKKFAAYLEISTASRSVTGTVEISPKHRMNKEVVIPGLALLPEKADDFVNINITINPLD